MTEISDFIEYAIAASALAVVLIANIVATRLIVRDQDSERRQKILQTAFVWLIPVIGAIIVFGVHRSHEKSTGRYREPPEPGDEYRDPARSASNRARSEVDLSDELKYKKLFKIKYLNITWNRRHDPHPPHA